MEKITCFSSVDQLDSDTEIQFYSDKCIPQPSQLIKREQIRQNLKNQLFSRHKFNDDSDQKSSKEQNDEIDTSKICSKSSIFQYQHNNQQNKQQIEIEKTQFIFHIDMQFSELFEEIGIIGQGCTGLVKKMRKISSKQCYAVKQIRTRDEERIQNIKNEFQHMKNLNHPNVVEVYELYIDEFRGNVYIVMELIEGLEMYEAIKKLGSYNESTARRLFKQIIEAIDFIHKKKICHRDLKPNNIICNKEGTKLKITDFNVSKFYDDEDCQEDQTQGLQHQVSTSHDLQMWTNTGTVSYQAPEIFKGESYTDKVDIWSAGVILYTMLSGKEPFQSLYVEDIIKKITNGQFDFLDEIWENISDGAKDLICKCLTMDPAQRITPTEALIHPWFTFINLNIGQHDNEINLNQLIKYKRRRYYSEYQIQVDGFNIKSENSLFDQQQLIKKDLDDCNNNNTTYKSNTFTNLSIACCCNSNNSNNNNDNDNNNSNSNNNNNANPHNSKTVNNSNLNLMQQHGHPFFHKTSIEVEVPYLNSETSFLIDYKFNQSIQKTAKRKNNSYLNQIPEVDDNFLLQDLPLNSIQVQKKIKQF